MKKVYLVYATLFYQDGNRTKFIINAFLSLSKAVSYADYKRLCVERNGAAHVFGSFVDSAVISFESESICTYDWSDDLKKLQDEKYNLLEFV